MVRKNAEKNIKTLPDMLFQRIAKKSCPLKNGG